MLSESRIEAREYQIDLNNKNKDIQNLEADKRKLEKERDHAKNRENKKDKNRENKKDKNRENKKDKNRENKKDKNSLKNKNRGGVLGCLYSVEWNGGMEWWNDHAQRAHSVTTYTHYICNQPS